VSYDLMVFELGDAPTERTDFMKWYDAQTEWSEDHSYEDPAVSSAPLKSWFQEMINFYPAMNGPHASDDVDDPKVTDFSVGKSVIYAAFAWSEAENALATMRELAIKHNVGFFDVSADNGEILIPNATSSSSQDSKPWWKFW
jgi:hypothetical protein